MSFNQPVEEKLEIRRKRLRYLAWHRGMRELDLILGPYVDRHVNGLAACEMDELEALFTVPDNTLFRWIAGQEPVPAEHDTSIMRNLISSAAWPQGR